MKSPWIKHLNQIKKHNPELSYRERVKVAQETYKKDEEKEIKNYVTREEFKEFEEYISFGFILLFGVALTIPILYSITANSKNYLGFYLMCLMGLFCIVYSFIKYFQLRKKYKQ